VGIFAALVTPRVNPVDALYALKAVERSIQTRQPVGLEPIRKTLQPPSSAAGTPPGAGYPDRLL